MLMTAPAKKLQNRKARLPLLAAAINLQKERQKKTCVCLKKCVMANTKTAKKFYVQKLTCIHLTCSCATRSFTASNMRITTARAINGVFIQCTISRMAKAIQSKT